jgi:hypothetical protein
MNSTATAVAFRGRSGPRVGDSQRVSQAALQAELVRGAMVRNTQSISPMPDPLKPAPLLGLVELAALAVVAVIGELVKRFAQLWGSNNSRAKQDAIWDKYQWYKVVGPGGSTQWESINSGYPIARSGAPWVFPNSPVKWPGQISWSAEGGAYGDLGLYYIKGINGSSDSNLYHVANGESPPGSPLVGPAYTYQFANSFEATQPLETWSGVSNTAPGSPITGDDSSAYTRDTAPVVPITGLSPLDRLPPVPAAVAAVAQTAPLEQAQTPTTEGVPVVPTVTPSPALVTTAQTTRTNFYMPDRLPAPLAPPATKTRTTTGAGTVVAPAALPIPQTSTDQRVYGSQVITSIGVRPDVVAIAEEVGRMEQKMGRLLGNMDQTPDWLDGAIGPLLNALKEALLDALVVDVPATSYDFEAPCDVDANGDPVVVEQAIAAADYQPAIVARLDAIAAAMGILKGWKQPMCRTSPPRSNVTVTAYEFDPEA